MSVQTSAFDELRPLLSALYEETITAEQMERLEQLVLSDPSAEANYVQFMSLHADLVGQFGASPARVERLIRNRVEGGSPIVADALPNQKSKAKQPAPSRHSSRLLRGAPIALAGLAAGLLLALTLWHRPQDAPSPGLEPEAVDNTVAVLLQAPGAEWDEGSPPTRVGDPLPPGWLRLKSGLAHIEFYSGATVILEGPAELQLVSRMEAFCARGRLRATVPTGAHGFKIGSPQLNLVDRGTEFGLQVSDGGKTEVHVFDGKVELGNRSTDQTDPSHRELTTGQGIRLDGAHDVTEIELNSSAFRTAQELDASSAAAIRRQHQKWLAAGATLRQDPSLLVHYSFDPDQEWNRELRDQAASDESHDGAIVGCLWVSGRWPGKHALEFKRVSDRVRFHVKHEFESITLAVWVRPDALPNGFNSLMITDGWDDGEPHWHIHKNGTLELGVQGLDRKINAHYYAPEAVSQERLGQWMHLAVVYDGEAGTVTHFVDGRAIQQEPVKFVIPLHIGDAELGNWNIGTHRNSSAVRYFVGCMDEFMMFRRALREEEIERLHTEGRPLL